MRCIKIATLKLPSLPANIQVPVLIASSILSSALLILTNKYLMRQYGFNKILSLSSLHFAVTAVITKIMIPHRSLSSISTILATDTNSNTGRFSGFVNISLPALEQLFLVKAIARHLSVPINVTRWQLAIFGTGSIVFMNYNLKFNPVSLYQLSKLLCIPYMLLWTRISLGGHLARLLEKFGCRSTLMQNESFPILTKNNDENLEISQNETSNANSSVSCTHRSNSEAISTEMLISLSLILIGVGAATIKNSFISTNSSSSLIGLVFAALAVSTTSHFQMWQGSKQKQHGLNSIELAYLVMPFQFAVCSILALWFEWLYPFLYNEFSNEETAYVNGKSMHGIWMVILSTCLLAAIVNLLTYALIGRTSAVTYQVVGHLKTVLTLAGGYVMFHSVDDSTSDGSGLETPAQIYGVLMAFLGMILYGDIKSKPVGKSFLCLLSQKLIETSSSLMDVTTGTAFASSEVSESYVLRFLTKEIF